MTADYIIVGGGSAGSALAHRLATYKPDAQVLLLEAGGWDINPFIHVPAAIIKAIGNPSLDWQLMSEPDPSRNNRVDLWPAGKVLGGSSSINGMLFVRGARHDFDRWSAAGCTGWDYDSLLPAMKRLEHTTLGRDDLRGRAGPVRINRLRSTHPLAKVFVDAAIAEGESFNTDYNDGEQGGVAYSQVTQRRGWRFHTSRAYLWPGKKPSNLRIMTRTQVEALTWDGQRCTGVKVRQGGQSKSLKASKEVVLSAGTLATPKILMLSGIGPADQLKAHGIEVKLDRGAVGQNLQEHPEGMVGIDVNQSTYNVEINSWKIVLHAVNWALFGRGPATSPYPHAVAFLKSSDAVPQPDIQVQLGPYAFSFDENGVIPYDKPAISAAVNISYPTSRGQVRLRSGDAGDPVIIDHGLLSDETDMAKLIAGCKRVRDILNSDAFGPHRVGERLPGPDVQSDDEWADYLRRTSFLGYHPVGTARMGSDDGAVVAPDLKVRGVEGVRVADASIMPDLISGNTNGTAILIGEKAADLIAEKEAA